MVQAGQKLKLDRGTEIQIDSFLSMGGEGRVYKARDIHSGSMCALKLFNSGNDNQAKRLGQLLDAGESLIRNCQALRPPTDGLISRGTLAHLSPLVDGITLEDYMDNPDQEFDENVKLTIALCHAIAILNDHGFSHGDIHPGNILVQFHHSGPRLYIIDFDNFYCPRSPSPQCIGNLIYLAPELRLGLRDNTQTLPNELSDRYALAALIHEILTRRHVAHGAMNTSDELEETVISGKWTGDPANRSHPWQEGEGYPPQMLNNRLAQMFRRSLSAHSESRPSALEWRDTLLEIYFNDIYIHEDCGYPAFVGSGTEACPFCHKEYPRLSLKFKTTTIILDSASMPIGRSILASNKVSSLHAVCKQVGPVFYIKPLGRNGVYRRHGKKWSRMDDNRYHIIQKGDRLRFADQECSVL